LRYYMPIAFVFSMAATGLELARVMGVLTIGFLTVVAWVFRQIDKMMDDHEPETTTSVGELASWPSLQTLDRRHGS
jgi:hypothetical protein